jgi:ribonuclease E
LSRDRTKHQVAEVTSLGLVQMTRKKLGLGLLETFSEPCDVCAGRGIVIHHDPVNRRHVQSPQSEPGTGRRSRGKGGSGQQQQQQQPQQQRQASGVNGTHAITEDARHALAQIAASTVLHEQGLEADAEPNTTVEILDIPVVSTSSRGNRRRRTPDAEVLLDSVLEALPEPKQSGQGRARVSRRASSAGAVITPQPEAE